ncbi:hypothetical protein, partial [Dapis sp. BLCC M172]|uniref:hypothetical protein n=1 Tax=Dapis sp. BLCC M172 TaxID=2975281 RepID=UPI003CF80038
KVEGGLTQFREIFSTYFYFCFGKVNLSGKLFKVEGGLTQSLEIFSTYSYFCFGKVNLSGK